MKAIVTAAVLATFLAAPVMAEEKPATKEDPIKMACEKKAVETKITKEGMEKFMKDCIAKMTAKNTATGDKK